MRVENDRAKWVSGFNLQNLQQRTCVVFSVFPENLGWLARCGFGLVFSRVEGQYVASSAIASQIICYPVVNLPDQVAKKIHVNLSVNSNFDFELLTLASI